MIAAGRVPIFLELEEAAAGARDQRDEQTLSLTPGEKLCDGEAGVALRKGFLQNDYQSQGVSELRRSTFQHWAHRALSLLSRRQASTELLR